MSAQKTTKFPFSTIVVTNPDEASAQSAQTLLDSTLKRYLNNNKCRGKDDIKIISTCDPFGARCGSFGGTVAAIDLIMRQNGGERKEETVLMLHAGGDSSRCPLSMILGKAWTNLPSLQFRNPIEWLIHQMELLFYKAKIPKGSLVIQITDCLVTLGEEEPEAIAGFTSSSSNSDQEKVDPYTVLGVAVPAPVYTAKNHGVYVMPEKTIDNAVGDSSSFRIEPPIAVLQKPTVKELFEGMRVTETSKTIQTAFNLPSRAGKQSWLDTGIVVFYPKAFQILQDVSEGLLSMCTQKGLEAAYQEAGGEDCPEFDSLRSFAKGKALKIDLYTDVLHNLPLENNRKALPPPPSAKTAKDIKDTKETMRKILSLMSLQVLTIPDGSFLHLGTTQELIDFITTDINPSSSGKRFLPTIIDDRVALSLAKSLRLNQRFKTLSVPEDDSAEGHNTTLCSIFPDDTMRSELGSSTYVEYSNLQSYESVKVGNLCLLSGWRPSHENSEETSLSIPDCLSVQLLPLKAKEEKWVMMVLGTTDSIKEPLQSKELYGVNFRDFVARTGISGERIGFGKKLTDRDSLWAAKIHPLVNSVEDQISFSSYFGWIEKLRAGDASLNKDESFLKWLSADRVSLYQIHEISDASKERTYRTGLDAKIWKIEAEEHIQTILVQLKDTSLTMPCDLTWLTELDETHSYLAFSKLSDLVLGLEGLAQEEFASDSFDISGKALMLASTVLADVPVIYLTDGDKTSEEASVVNKCKQMISEWKIASPSNKLHIMKKIMVLRMSGTWNQSKASVAMWSEILEDLALSMIELNKVNGYQSHSGSMKPTPAS